MSDVAVRQNLNVKGNVSADQVSYVTGDNRPLLPMIQDAAGIYTFDVFSAGKYRSAEYTIQISQPTVNAHEVLRALVLHDGTNAYLNEYGRVTTLDTGVEFSVVLANGFLEISYSQPGILTQIKAIGFCLT